MVIPTQSFPKYQLFAAGRKGEEDLLSRETTISGGKSSDQHQELPTLTWMYEHPIKDLAMLLVFGDVLRGCKILIKKHQKVSCSIFSGDGSQAPSERAGGHSRYISPSDA